jgi:hypothetical protein
MPCLVVLIHHGLHDHTRGINTFAYGEFLFSFHLASAVLRNRQHPARTELALLINCSSWNQVVRSFIIFFSLPCISYHHFYSLLHQQPRTFFNNDFLFFLISDSQAMEPACLPMNQYGQGRWLASNVVPMKKKSMTGHVMT